MAKKIITQVPSDNSSTVKSRRRYLIADAVARRIIGEKEATWSSVATAFTGELLPLNVDLESLTELQVRAIIKSVLQGFIKTLDTLPPVKPASKKADDLQGILLSVPRRKRCKK